MTATLEHFFAGLFVHFVQKRLKVAIAQDDRFGFVEIFFKDGL